MTQMDAFIEKLLHADPRSLIAPEGVEVSEDAFDECHPDLAFEDLPPAE